jgi:hypothetical protein
VRKLRLLPAVLFALLVLAVYADPLLTGRIFSGRDLIAYNHPMEKAIHSAWSHGSLPVWQAGVSGGRPLAPNPNAGALYPVRAVLSAAPFATAIRVFPVIHWLAAGLGTLLLLRCRGISRAGAFLGATTYVFSGVGVALVFYPNLQPGMALLPWIVWSLGRPDGSFAAKAIRTGTLLGLDFLAGDVFTSGMGLLACGLWIALAEEPAARRRAAGALAAAIALGACLALPAILGAALWAPETSRSVSGLQLGNAFLFSIPPARLLELVVPFPFGDVWSLEPGDSWGWAVFRYKSLGMFSTFFCGGFVVVAFAGGWRDRSGLARFARATFLTALAAGVLPGLLPRAFESMAAPLPLRNPEKFSILLSFAASVVAALAWDRFRQSGAPRRWPLGVGGFLAAGAAVAALWPDAAGRLAVACTGTRPEVARSFGATADPSAVARARLPAALAEAGLLWMATVVALELLAHGNRRSHAVALLLLCSVPIAADRRIARTFSEDATLAPSALARFVRRYDPDGAFRVLGESLFRPRSALAREQSGADEGSLDFARREWIQHTPSLWEQGTVLNDDFDVGDLSRVESLRRTAGLASGYRDAQRFWGALALRWGVRYRDQSPLAGYRRIGGDALLDWDEHAEPFRDIRLLETWTEARGALEALHLLPGLGPGGIVLETGSAGRGNARAGEVRILVRRPEQLDLEVQTLDPTWLFVLRAHWPFRRILLDGGAVEDIPAQLAFSAVRVPPGIHHIFWREELPGWSTSRWGPALYLLGGAFLAVMERPRALKRS